MNGHRLFGRIMSFLTAFFGCWAIQSSIRITVRNPLTVVLFLCLFFLSDYVRSYSYQGEHEGAALILPHIPGLAAGIILARMIYPGVSAEFTSSLFRLMTFGILLVGYYLLICLFIKLLILLIRKSDHVKMHMNEDVMVPDKLLSDTYNRMVKLIIPMTAVICFLCYLPYFLYEFPGIMTADSIVQYLQIIGREPYSNHHPVVHTLMIRFFYELGMIATKDAVRAISFYTLAQMTLVSITFGVLAREILLVMGKADFRVIAAMIAFFALFPVNAVFAVTIWKDIPFAMTAALLVCLISSMYRRGAEAVTGPQLALYSVLGALFSLLRSNAWFAFLVFTPIFVYCFRAKLRQAVAASAIAIAIVIIVKGPVFGAMGVKGPDFVESLSLPLQQVARVLVDDRPIEEEDLKLIDEVIDRTYIKELYNKGYADNIKELVRAGNPGHLEDNKSVYLGLWARLLLKYPGEYIAAWYDLEGGYIYPDFAYKVADADGIMPNDLGLYPAPIIGGRFIKIKEIVIKLSDFMPLYGMLFSIGAYAIGLVIALLFAVWKKRNVLPHLLMLFLLLTLLIAAPVVDFRYGYAYVVTFPVLAAISFTKTGEVS